jgi:hypothetical protein
MSGTRNQAAVLHLASYLGKSLVIMGQAAIELIFCYCFLEE